MTQQQLVKELHQVAKATAIEGGHIDDVLDVKAQRFSWLTEQLFYWMLQHWISIYNISVV